MVSLGRGKKAKKNQSAPSHPHISAPSQSLFFLGGKHYIFILLYFIIHQNISLSLFCLVRKTLSRLNFTQRHLISSTRIYIPGIRFHLFFIPVLELINFLCIWRINYQFIFSFYLFIYS